MIYEDAIKLKHAGFPQDVGDGTRFTTESVIIRDGVRVEAEECYAPTTEELIAFCDKGWLKIEHCGDNGWVACRGALGGPEGRGKYLEEALTNLYVAMAKEKGV